jgi:hypothetical protein
LNVGNLRLDQILIFQESLIFKDGSGERGRDWTLVRSDSLWVFKPEFIDTEALDFRVERPRGNA